MERIEMLRAALESLGLQPQGGDGSPLYVCHQMKQFFLLADDEEMFVTMVLPKFYDLKEGEEGLALAICNKMTRDIKLVKVFVDEDFQSVTASCEFYFHDAESLAMGIQKSLGVMQLVRSTFFRTKAEMGE